MHELIEQRREAILAIAKKHGVTNVRIFVSMARGTADEGDGAWHDLLSYFGKSLEPCFPEG